MIFEIKSKWVVNYKNWNLIITNEFQIFDIKTKILLVEIWNNGTISYRIPGTNSKIGKATIYRFKKPKEIVIQDYVPF